MKLRFVNSAFANTLIIFLFYSVITYCFLYSFLTFCSLFYSILFYSVLFYSFHSFSYLALNSVLVLLLISSDSPLTLPYNSPSLSIVILLIVIISLYRPLSSLIAGNGERRSQLEEPPMKRWVIAFYIHCPLSPDLCWSSLCASNCDSCICQLIGCLFTFSFLLSYFPCFMPLSSPSLPPSSVVSPPFSPLLSHLSISLLCSLISPFLSFALSSLHFSFLLYDLSSFLLFVLLFSFSIFFSPFRSSYLLFSCLLSYLSASLLFSLLLRCLNTDQIKRQSIELTISLIRESPLWSLFGDKWTDPRYYRSV